MLMEYMVKAQHCDNWLMNVVVANCNELLNNMDSLACFASQDLRTLRPNCLHVILR